MSTRVPDPDTYASLPEEMFVIGADDTGAEEIARPSTTY